MDYSPWYGVSRDKVIYSIEIAERSEDRTHGRAEPLAVERRPDTKIFPLSEARFGELPSKKKPTGAKKAES
jgi:hypothetical protein